MQFSSNGFSHLTFLKHTRSIGFSSHAVRKRWLLVCLFSWILSHLSPNTVRWNCHFGHIFGNIHIFPWNTIIFVATQKRRGKTSTQNYLNYQQYRNKHSFILQLAEKSFRFYRNIGQDDTMPADISKEWNDLRARVEEMVQTEKKVSKFECKELCKFWKLMY